MCGEGGEEPSMPLARYFLWVGAVLLALLLIADLSLPELPVARSADARLPAIHIQSVEKLPDRVVYDTSIATIIPAPLANREANIPAAATVAYISAARQAFAQSQPSDAKQPQRSDPRKRDTRQRHHRFATRRAAPSALLAARQPFGWFGTGFW